jgi:hypothetical protein
MLKALAALRTVGFPVPSVISEKLLEYLKTTEIGGHEAV